MALRTVVPSHALLPELFHARAPFRVVDQHQIARQVFEKSVERVRPDFPDPRIAQQLANVARREAKRRLDKADEKVEELKLQIQDFADQMGFTKLQGHGCAVTVSKSPMWKMPSMYDPQRKTLENIVRDSGLWDQVSDLSKSKLTKTIGGKSFDPQFRDQIQKFLKRDITTTVRLSIKEGNTIEDGPDPG